MGLAMTRINDTTFTVRAFGDEETEKADEPIAEISVLDDGRCTLATARPLSCDEIIQVGIFMRLKEARRVLSQREMDKGEKAARKKLKKAAAKAKKDAVGWLESLYGRDSGDAA